MDRSCRVGALREDVDDDGCGGEVVWGARVISAIYAPGGQHREGGIIGAEGDVEVDVVVHHPAVVIPAAQRAKNTATIFAFQDVGPDFSSAAPSRRMHVFHVALWQNRL